MPPTPAFPNSLSFQDLINEFGNPKEELTIWVILE